MAAWKQCRLKPIMVGHGITSLQSHYNWFLRYEQEHRKFDISNPFNQLLYWVRRLKLDDPDLLNFITLFCNGCMELIQELLTSLLLILLGQYAQQLHIYIACEFSAVTKKYLAVRKLKILYLPGHCQLIDVGAYIITEA